MYNNKRDEIEGHGIVLGAVTNRQGFFTIHSQTEAYAHVVQGVVAALIDLGHWPKDFGFTSFQFLKNARVLRHVDSNISTSLIFSFGPFTGGAFRTLDGELNIYQRPTLFKGDKEHWVEDHDGIRYSIALYSHKRANERRYNALDHVGVSIGLRMNCEKALPVRNSA